MSPRDVPPGWADGEDGRLESRLAELAADLVVLGEAAFRQGLVEARERDEEHQRWLEERARERRAEHNRQRLGHLEASGALLRQADDLRALVERVGAAVGRGNLALDDGELAA
jgi:hypothetical protein